MYSIDFMAIFPLNSQHISLNSYFTVCLRAWVEVKVQMKAKEEGQLDIHIIITDTNNLVMIYYSSH